MKNIDIYPYSSGKNRYIDILKNILSDFYISSPPKSFSTFVKRRKNLSKSILVLNWIEDLPSNTNSLGVFFKVFAFLMLSRIFYRRIIWIRHNIKPHSNHLLFTHKILIILLNFISDRKLAHTASLRNLTYIPHPMYYEDKSLVNSKVRDIEYLYFGAIKEYKNIVNLVYHWPRDIPMLLVGECEDIKLEYSIRHTIENKKIEFINEYLDECQLCELVMRAKNVILPHQANSMIVSGAFFFAASLGCNILMSKSDFFYFCIDKYSFIRELDFERLKRNQFDYTAPTIVYEEIFNENNKKKISLMWCKIIKGLK